MPTAAQRRASTAHRKRAAARGLVRVEVQVESTDADLLRKLAARLRSNEIAGRATRDLLRNVVEPPAEETALTAFGSDLPDEYFEGVFDAALRRDKGRKVEL